MTSSQSLSKNAWKPLRLGEVLEFGNGKTRPNSIGDYPIYGGNGILGYANQTNYTGETIVIGRVGAYCGSVYFENNPIWVSDNALAGKPKNNNNAKFLYYFLKNIDLNQFALGSSHPLITQTLLNSIDIEICNEPEEQKAIGGVLSSLDEKIDLLHRQNKTLEAMAETLFRQWFIEEANEEWEEKPLDRIAEFLNGLACQKYPPQNDTDKLPVLKIKDLRSGFTEKSDWASTDISSEYIINNGDVIFSWSGSLMIKIWDGEKCILNQHLFKVTSSDYPKWFYFFWTKYHLDNFISIAESKSTTMGHIKREDLSNSMVLVPSDHELKIMNASISYLFDKIILNNRQITSLEKLRDTVLPKLMSGEVRVAY